MQLLRVYQPPSNTIPFDPRRHHRINQISNISGIPPTIQHISRCQLHHENSSSRKNIKLPTSRIKLWSSEIEQQLRNGCPETAHQVFGKMLQRDVVSWTVVISDAYKSGQLEKAVHYFRWMMDEGVAPDNVALVSILSVSARRGCLNHGIEVHGYLIRMGFHPSYALTSSLVNLYAKLGRMDYADRIFCCTVEKNVVAWTAMMAGLARARDPISALLMYGKMVNSNIEPNEKSVSCALRAVCQLGFLRLGMQFHGYIIKRKFVLDEYILSGLIELYAKSGASTDICRILFDKIVHKNAVLCTSMISVYGRRGEGLAALQLFNEMRAAGMNLDSVAFTAILSACCSSGLLHEGLKCFELMIQDYKVKPREEHYACLKGLFAKDRRLDEAYEAIEFTRLKDDGRIWEVFLGACRVHGDMEYGEIVSRKLSEVESGNSSNYTIC